MKVFNSHTTNIELSLTTYKHFIEDCAERKFSKTENKITIDFDSAAEAT